MQASGGLTLAGTVQPLVFTWNTAITVSGSGWAPGEQVRIALEAPGITARTRRARRPADMPSVSLGSVTADASGKLAGTATIPYDNGVVGPQARIPVPGYYEVVAAGPVSGTAVAPARINLCPDTYTGPGATATYDWGKERGGRDGVFPGQFRQFSPERFDPEWPTAWSERPVELYGTVPAAGADANDLTSRISPSDNPPTHYAHDTTVYVDPDPEYRWQVGTSNYYAGEGAELRRIELEWETLNGGSTATYGQGKIGLPVWAVPAPGDRVYAVGRWILDAGHPELGDRTEIHPPRLVAAIRSRPAATEVDLYVSGHGGGANTMPPGLSAVLDQGGYGGGRIRDVLSPSDQDKYYRPGPVSTFLFPLLQAALQAIAGVQLTDTVYADAGPSAFPWGAPGPEERAINDRDYDFDVPLPPPPPGGGVVMMDTATHAEHTTGVNETVTFLGPRGRPTVAHIHLPYNGADNGVYARTLRFGWANGAPPAIHYTVRLTQLTVNDSAGKWQMWSDVAGQWTYLSGAVPQLLNTSNGATVALPGTPVDVYLKPGQKLHVDVHGYRAACLDDYFGKLFGDSPYLAGLTFVSQCGPTDNQDLGAAVLDVPAQPAPTGVHTVTAADASGAHHFTVTVSIE